MGFRSMCTFVRKFHKDDFFFYFPFMVSSCLKKYNNLSKYLNDNGAKEAL